MRACPICNVNNDIVKTLLERDEYTECQICGLLYTHKDLTINDVSDYYDYGRDKNVNYYDDYINNPNEASRNSILANQIIIMSDEEWANKDVLEIGSSVGWLSYALKLREARVKCLDISRVATDYAIKYHKLDCLCVNWELVNIDDMHWNNNFDFVITIHTVHLFINPVEAINKIALVLRSGGAWITQHPDATVFPGVKFHVRGDTPREHLQIFDSETILKITSSAGLKRVLYMKEDPGQSISIFRKIK